MCPSATPSSLIGLLWHKEFAFRKLGPACSAVNHSSAEQSCFLVSPVFYAFVQYCLSSATNTHVKLTYASLLSSRPTLGGLLHQDRTDQTVVKTSLKLYSYLIAEGSEMFIVLCASILLVISILPSVHLQLSQ